MKSVRIFVALGIMMSLFVASVANAAPPKHSAAWYKAHRKPTKHSAAWYRAHRKPAKHSAAWYRAHRKPVMKHSTPPMHRAHK